MTNEDLVREGGRFLAELAPVWSPLTTLQHRQGADDLFGFLAREARTLDAAAILAWVAEMRSRTVMKTGQLLSPSTVKGRLQSVRRFLGWLRLRGLVLQDLAALVKLPNPGRLPRTLAEAEVVLLLEKEPGGPMEARDRAILELLYGTGLRIAEVAKLQLGDVALYEEVVTVRQGKGRKDRLVPFGHAVRDALARYLRELRPRRPGRFFLSAYGKPMSSETVGEMIRRARKRAGLAVAATAHRLRHSYATHMLRRGADVRHIQRLLGHAHLGSTEVYLSLETADLARMIERCHPLERSRPGRHAGPRDDGGQGEDSQ